MSIEMYGPFPSGYFCFIFDIELFVTFGDEFFTGIFLLKYFFSFSVCFFLSFRVSFSVKMLLRLITSLCLFFFFFPFHAFSLWFIIRY